MKKLALALLVLTFMCGCGSGGKAPTAPLTPTALTITTTSLPNGVLGEAYSASVAVSGGTLPYTWSVTSGTLPAGLSLSSSSGSISGTPMAVGTSNFTVTVTDSSTPTPQTASQSLAITVNVATAACTDSGNERVVNGQYAFSLSGYNATGFLAAVGSFTADGLGHITAGEVDSNGALGVQQADINTSASSYSVGSTDLGCATIATSFGTFTTRFALGTLSSGKATEGRVIEWETGSSAYIAAGQILLQTASSFSTRLTGNYVFEQAGWNSGVSAVGVMSVGGGFITTGEMDSNNAGVTSNITGVTGTYSSADTSGRLTLTTTWSGQSATNLVGYMVSGSELLIMTTDPTGGVVAGEMTQQSGTFKDSSVSGEMVFYDTGLATPQAGGTAELGLISSKGAGSLTVTDYVDEAGTWATPNPTTLTCSYSVASNGRMTLSGASCGPLFTLYLTAANTAVLLSGGMGEGIGQVAAQTAGPFTTASLPSTFYFGTLGAVNQDVETAAGVGTASGGSVTGTQDVTATTSQTPDQAIEFRLTVNSNGILISSDAPGLTTGIIISATEFVNVDNQGSAYPTVQVVKH